MLIDDSTDDSNQAQQLSELEVVEKQSTNTAAQEVASVIPEKYKGKSTEDIIKMHQEAEKLIGKQAQEVGEVRKLADELIKQNLQSKSNTQVNQQTEVEPEVDFFEDPHKAIKKTVDNHPDVLAARQAAQEFKRMQIQQQLATNHPDFTQIVQDPEFANWVKGSKVRLALYAKADGEYDYDSADELLSTFKQLRSVQVKQEDEATQATRAKTMKAVSVDTGGTGESSKKVYRRADLIQLKIRDPERYMSLQDEIMKAYAEGRVK
jgi:hypothetical protein